MYSDCSFLPIASHGPHHALCTSTTHLRGEGGGARASFAPSLAWRGGGRGVAEWWLGRGARAQARGRRVEDRLLERLLLLGGDEEAERHNAASGGADPTKVGSVIGSTYVHPVQVQVCARPAPTRRRDTMAVLVSKPAQEGHGPRARARMLLALLHMAVAASEPQRAGSSFWRTPIVLVPTVWIGEGKIPTSETMDSEPWVMKLAATPQSAQVTSHFGNHLQVAPGRFSVFFYQRVDPAQPHFCGDYALEVGAYLCFLDDWYDDLPDVTVFLHQMPSAHNLLMAEWVALLRTDLTFTTLSPQYIIERGTEMWAHQNISAWVEQCYRDALKLAGVHHPKRKRVAMSGCAPRPAYLAASAIAGHNARRDPRWRDCRAAPQVLLHRVCSEP